MNNDKHFTGYPLNISDSQLTVRVKISGPFLNEQAEKKLNETVSEEYRKMDVWLETWSIDQLDGNVTVSIYSFRFYISDKDCALKSRYINEKV